MQAQSLTRCGKAKVATTSARRSVLCKPNHLHPVGRQRWQQHQQGGLDFASPITYILWEGKGSNNISKEVWTCARPISYILWEGKGGNNISQEVWTLQAQSLTSCGKAKVATTSARMSGLCRPNHLHTVGRQRWQQHQQGCLDFASPITYRLWEGKGGNNISKEVWTLQAQSLTNCGKAKVAITSARRSGLCKPNHLQPVGRQMWQQQQQGGLNFAGPITYRLWEGKGGNNISKEVWTLQAQSLTGCGKERWPQHQQGGLDFANPITYILWKGKGGNISKEVWTLQAQSLTGCGKASMATTSARNRLCKPNHLHTVGRQRQQQHQQGGLDFATQSLTYCEKGKVATTSVRRSGLCKPNHLHAVGSQRQQQH